MAGDVDDVVGAAHDVEVAVGVLEAGVGGLVVAGKLGEVALEALVLLPQRRQARRRQRQLDHDRAHLVGRHLPALLVDDAHVVARHRHAGRAVLDRKRPSPTGLPPIAQPVSVCHQWSITGFLSSFSAQITVSGSARSPARNSVRNFDRSYWAKNFPCGSSFLMARNAVGAVNMATQPCSAITRQNAPASGAHRLALVEDRGAAVEQRRVDDVAVADHPADVGGRPPALARLDAVEMLIDHLSATMWPPLSRTTPFGMPVVPEV